MNNPIVRQVGLIAAMVLSVLVALIAAAGIIGVWIGNSLASNLVVELSVAVEQSAQRVERGIARVDTGVGNLRGEVQDVTAAVNQISQNINDRGLVVTLLPESKEQKLQAAANQVFETYDAVSDALDSARATYRALNRIPGVRLPAPDETVVQNVNTTLQETRQFVADLSVSVANIRRAQANQIDRVTNLTTEIDARLTRIEQNLQAVTVRLQNVQNRARQLRESLPLIFTLVAIVATLLLVWVFVSQVLVLGWAWRKWKSASRVPEPRVTTL